MVRVESVGAKVGSDLRRKGFAAVIIATIFMGVYIAIQFRHVSWSFGAGAVIALIHDVLVVMCALVISQYQFDLTTLAAVLTVIGYSVHDTIIVSDRIREDSTKRRREPIASIMNRAINETLSRTILTSGTAIVVLLSLLAFGGPILRPSAFTLLIGFITGTYSSIYIAGPVVLFWESGTGRSAEGHRLLARRLILCFCVILNEGCRSEESRRTLRRPANLHGIRLANNIENRPRHLRDRERSPARANR